MTDKEIALELLKISEVSGNSAIPDLKKIEKVKEWYLQLLSDLKAL